MGWAEVTEVPMAFSPTFSNVLDNLSSPFLRRVGEHAVRDLYYQSNDQKVFVLFSSISSAVSLLPPTCLPPLLPTHVCESL